jgi:acetolactate synthase I/II/III large subunit
VIRSGAGLRVADVIARAIADTGVNVAFGHPGGEVVQLIDALRRAGIRFILTHHETTAAFMAGGYGEITARPGVCVCTLGPGATNMTTGTASALLERAPMLALTAATPAAAPAGATHQILNLSALYTPITKRSTKLDPATAADDVHAGIAEALRPRPGPVHFAIAADVATAPVEDLQTASRPPQASSPRRLPPHDAITAAQRMIERARRPAIVVGLGANQRDVQVPLARLAHRLGSPVTVLPKAKGIFAEDDDLFVGVLEMAGNELVAELLLSADLLLAVGVDPVEMDNQWAFGAPTIHIDQVPNTDRYYPAQLELVGDIAAILTSVPPARTAPSAWTRDGLDKHRAALSAMVRPDLPGLQPWQVVTRLRQAFGRATISTCDVGAHKLLVGQTWQAYQPRTFFMANGLSSMGYAIPAAVAASLVADDHVVAFVGDGGFSMYLGELETLRRLNPDVTIVVFIDNSLELIRRAQQRAGVAEVGTSFSNPDFRSLAAAFDLDIIEINSRQELDKIIHRLPGRRGALIIAAHIDGADYRL